MGMKPKTLLFAGGKYMWQGMAGVEETQNQVEGRKRNMGKKRREQEKSNDTMLNLPS